MISEHPLGKMMSELKNLKDNEKGQIAERIIPSTLLWRIGPPELKEYAVEPVGVEQIIPSDDILANIWFFINKYKWDIFALFSNVNSFKA